MKLRRYPEVKWAVLRHYNACTTPLLDLTCSLRVAASFAVPIGNGEPSGKGESFVYVRVPAVAGSITYCTDDNLVLVRLSMVCPPKAKRPHFQEGYLVGDFPHDLEARVSTRHNLATRMLAKFRLPRRGFSTLPSDTTSGSVTIGLRTAVGFRPRASCTMNQREAREHRRAIPALAHRAVHDSLRGEVEAVLSELFDPDDRRSARPGGVHAIVHEGALG